MSVTTNVLNPYNIIGSITSVEERCLSFACEQLIHAIESMCLKEYSLSQQESLLAYVFGVCNPPAQLPV